MELTVVVKLKERDGAAYPILVRSELFMHQLSVRLSTDNSPEVTSIIDE